MRSWLVIAFAASAAMFFAIAHPALAQKNKKGKNQQVETLQTAAPQPLAKSQPFFYVTIRGSRQGIFAGQSSSPAHRGAIVGFQYLAQLDSPRNAGTGQISGKNQYTPVTFTKQWDSSSPQIHQAAATNEVLPLVEFAFVAVNPQGEEYVYHTVKLTNATISHVKEYMGFPDSGEPPDSRQLEDVSFTFQKIEISNNDGKTTSIDDWQAPM